MQTGKSGLHLLLIADILRQLVTNLIPTVSGGAYQDIRKVTTEWNARLKHCGPLKIRGSMHPASPSTLFSPIFSLAREKMGPPEARQNRPRRNKPRCSRSLLSSEPVSSFPNRKLNLRFGFFYANLIQPLSQPPADSIPTPFVPSGHFPLIGGIGPWEGSLFTGSPSGGIGSRGIGGAGGLRRSGGGSQSGG